MTDGSIVYDSENRELKTFNVKDGAGLKYWSQAGYRAGIITGRSSPMVTRRGNELDIEFIEMNAKQKLPVFERMLTIAGVAPEETAVVGDDLPDLPLIARAGFGVAVADAVDEVREAADMITNRKGGRGAVREVIEYLLRAQGRWNGI
ncbi:MAG: HAD hydrolase family protein, partial [Planctomycetes bacterium]|nr:HAD hydrolase family protein [Planctomycetota bacterium]